MGIADITSSLSVTLNAIDNLTPAIKKVRKEINLLKHEAAQLGSTLEKLNNKKFSRTDAINKSLAKGKPNVDAWTSAINASTDGYNRQEKFARNSMTTIDQFANKVLPSAIKNTSTLTQRIKKSTPAFTGWAMSLMFAGMALQRMFMGIAKTSVATFNEITSSVEGGTSGFMLLNGAVKELQFIVGSALEPIVQFLLPIVDAVIDWVSQHKELTKNLIIAGAILGSFLMYLGMIKLAWTNGIVPAVSSMLLKLEYVGAIVEAFAATLGIGVLPLILIIAAAAAVLYAAWKTNFGGIQDFIMTVFKVISTYVKTVFDNIKQIFSGLIDIIEGIFNGDLNQIIKGFLNVLAGAIKLVINIIATVADLIINAFAFSFNVVIGLAFSFVRILIQGLQKVASWVDKVFGTSLASKMGDLDTFMKDVQQSIKIDYGTPAQDLASTASTGIDNLVNHIVVELDGEKVGESVSKRINQSMASGSEF